MFRLNNKIVQVNFNDKTEILLNSEQRLVTYLSKSGEKTTMPLDRALESTNTEMTRRLKYTKDILSHMLQSSVKSGAGGAASQRASKIAAVSRRSENIAPPMSAATELRRAAPERVVDSRC